MIEIELTEDEMQVLLEGRELLKVVHEIFEVGNKEVEREIEVVIFVNHY